MSPYDPKLYPTEADVDHAFHRLPNGDAWKAVTLAHIEERGIRIILGCCGCQRRAMVWPRAYAEKHGIPMDMPLKALERRIRCTTCNARLIRATPELYSIRHDQLGELRE
jgi:hypothetical protein